VGGTVGLDGTGLQLFDAADPTLNLACSVWTPESDALACESWDDEHPARWGIHTVSATDGQAPQRLTHGPDIPCAFSPDGSQLAFVRQRSRNSDGTGTLALLDIESGVVDPMLTGVAIAGNPCAWSASLNSIIASKDGSLVRVTPGVSTRPTPIPLGVEGWVEGATWSPDASRVLFTLYTDDGSDVYTAEIDGSDPVRLTDPPMGGQDGVWLP
jgi:Tol biopolymer transport system component